MTIPAGAGYELGAALGPVLERLVEYSPGNPRLSAAIAAMYTAMGDDAASRRHLAAPTDDDGSKIAARLAMLRRAFGTAPLPTDDRTRPAWVAQMQELGCQIAAAQADALRYAAESQIAMLTTVAGLLRRHQVLRTQTVEAIPTENLWGWVRTHAMTAVVSATAVDDATAARAAVLAWAEAFEETIITSVLTWSSVVWEDTEADEVVAAITAAASGGPSLLAVMLSAIDDLAQPENVNVAELVGSTLAALDAPDPRDYPSD